MRRNRRVPGNETPVGKDVQPAPGPGVYSLDTDLEHMDGIIKDLHSNEGAKVNDGKPARPDEKSVGDQLGVNHWDAPESWHVKKQKDELTAKLPKKAYDAVLTRIELA